MRFYGIAFIFFAISSQFSSGKSLRTSEKLKSAAGHVIADVTHPVEKAIVTAASKNCDVFKKLFGATFDALHGTLNEPDVTKLTLDLYTKAGEKNKIKIRDAPSTLLHSKQFSTQKPIVIFLHGFLQSSESTSAKTITESILSQWDVNVLVVDSSNVLSFDYSKSSTIVRFIGVELGDMLAALVKGGKINPTSIHIVGHGLGAHIAGFSGKTFHDNMRRKIGHITGLDPAGPCFFQEKTYLKLKDSDADFVDVIHTDSGILGILDPLGHVDFYPNLGEKQPGCTSATCSHRRAWEIYSSSVNALHGFPAVKCASKEAYVSGSCDKNEKAYMGFATDKYTRGIYYLKTADKHPFALGKLTVGAAIIKGIFNIL